MKESDILYERGQYWVLRGRSAYHVMVNGVTHAESESSYALTVDGLSIAVARCKYLADTTH